MLQSLCVSSFSCPTPAPLWRLSGRRVKVAAGANHEVPGLLCSASGGARVLPLDPPYGWASSSDVFHTYLCAAALRSVKKRDWRTDASKPNGMRECKLCERARRKHQSTDVPSVLASQVRHNWAPPAHTVPAAAAPVIEQLSVMKMARSRGWARDYNTPPDPFVLGPHPSPLPPDLLVSVETKILDIFTRIAGSFVREVGGLAPPSVRQSAYYFRASPGIGKTFLLYKTWSWWLQRRAGLPSNGASDEPLNRSAATTFAASTELFGISFNGNTLATDEEVTWALGDNVPSSLFSSMRLIYAELIEPAVPWSDFVEAVHQEVLDEKQTLFDMGVSFRKVLRYCRGRPSSTPILLVDELSQSSLLFERPLGSANNKKFGSWAGLVRSQMCRRMQVAGGTVVFASLDKSLMTDETRSSGREMLQACRVGYFPALDFEAAVSFGMSPLPKDPNVVCTVGKLLKASGMNGTVCVARGLVRALTLLLGGHSRFVTLFTYNMLGLSQQTSADSAYQQRMAAAYKRILSKNYNVMGDVEVEQIVGAALALAGEGARVRPEWGSYPDGAAGARVVLMHVLLGRAVVSSDRVLQGVTSSADTWNDIAADGLIGLEDTVPAMVPWTLLGFRALLVEQADPFYSSLRSMLEFAGDRPTGTWLETFHVKWEVVISHSRSQFVSSYQSLSIRSLLCSSCPRAYVGSGYLINDVLVDSSVPRTRGVRPGVLADLLAKESKSRALLFRSVFQLYTAASQPGVSVDVAVFHKVKRNYQMPVSGKVLKEGSAVVVLYQIKDTGADSKVPSSTADVRDSLKNMREAVGEANWEVWKDRIVYVLIDRRVSKLFSSNCATSVAFRKSDLGKQCLLLTQADLPGLYSETLYNVLCAAEYLKSSVSDLSLLTDASTVP